MELLTCQVERVRYRNPVNNFNILKVRLKNRTYAIVKGQIEVVNLGADLKLYGEWEIDKQYGKQFCFERWEEILPDDNDNIEKYLASTIKGIGLLYAKRIVEKFGDKTFDILNSLMDDVTSESYNQAVLALKSVKGLGNQRLAYIEEAWKKQSYIKDIVIFLQQYDINPHFATKVFEIYGENSISAIKKNPYRLIDDIKGIGFKTADRLALKMGIKETSFMRLTSGIMYSMEQIKQQGHCYAQEKQLVNMVIKQLELNFENSSDDLSFDISNLYMLLDDLISDFSKSKKLGNNNLLIGENLSEDKEYEKIYLPYLYFSEIGVSNLIKKILKTPFKKKIKNISITSEIEYNDIQKEAILSPLNSKFIVITGGPGTGKTTVIKGILDLLVKNKLKVSLAAPTGRAAKRLSEATGQTAKTIHRLLEYNSYGNFNKDEKNLLNCDVLIVDETSMVDISLAYSLLKAVPSSSIVILVGDKDQLPSVGAGNVFRDIIDSNIVKVIRLKTIYRQAQDSDIIKNAYLVNNGEMPNLVTDTNSDFIFIDSSECEDVASYIVDLYINVLSKMYKGNPFKDIQILSPMNKGKVGTISLNLMVQDSLRRNEVQIYGNGFAFSVHDKVMQTENDYDRNVFNGDIGEVVSVDKENKSLIVDFYGEKVLYKNQNLENLSLAYAISIHKSQGSEFPIVIIPIMREHYIMLQKNLLYTGITRAKKLLILVGDKKQIFRCVKNDSVFKRNTSLKERLLEE